MDALLKILLIILYPLLSLARVLNALLGYDRLRLHSPPATSSCWIERSPDLGSVSYFSEASVSEGRPHSSAGKPISRVLCLLARMYAPIRQSTEGQSSTVAERDRDIPDEVYTLW